MPHEYDIVEGPMADDWKSNHALSHLGARASRAAFWELARFRRPTHHLSFHGERSLARLQFARGIEVTDDVLR